MKRFNKILLIIIILSAVICFGIKIATMAYDGSHYEEAINTKISADKGFATNTPEFSIYKQYWETLQKEKWENYAYIQNGNYLATIVNWGSNIGGSDVLKRDNEDEGIFKNNWWKLSFDILTDGRAQSIFGSVHAYWDEENYVFLYNTISGKGEEALYHEAIEKYGEVDPTKIELYDNTGKMINKLELDNFVPVSFFEVLNDIPDNYEVYIKYDDETIPILDAHMIEKALNLKLNK